MIARIRSFAVAMTFVLLTGLALGQTGDSKMNTLTEAEAQEGWTLLFDGKSTKGWRGYKKEGFPEKGWSIEDQALRVHAGGGGGDVMPLETYEDFELVVDWRVSPGANSGIMYRVRETADTPWQTGPEYQILDDAEHSNAGPTTSAGALYALVAPEGKKPKPTGEYNSTRIRHVGNRVEHWLNGVQVLECEMGTDEWNGKVAASKFKAYSDFGKHQRGYIVFQDHGNDVWFRNIKIRDLNPPEPAGKSERLFNGRNLEGWKAVLADEGASADRVWSVDDEGVLVCTGRPVGYIRTETDYANFLLRVEWRFPTGSPGGNSGVLFRMTGADKVWPRSIEAQLQTQNAGDFWNIDKFPMQVADWRTNGRNTKKTHFAEKPIGEWNVYEILADGGHIVLKVNGEVLNEAWDAAEMPGKICLQSEGAEIHFRTVSITPLRARGGGTQR